VPNVKGTQQVPPHHQVATASAPASVHAEQQPTPPGALQELALESHWRNQPPDTAAEPHLVTDAAAEASLKNAHSLTPF